VKVRGFRIELGEIESVLVEHAAVSEAVVVALEEAGDKRLLGYIACGEAAAPSVSALREHLRVKLPDYMVPSVFVFLPSLPLTANGKVDRKALPKPDGSEWQGSDEYVAPRNPAEASMVKIFSNLLGRERVGVNDSFFDLGGHSMLAIRLLNEIAKVFGRKLAIRTLFESATVAALVKALAQDQDTECWTILNTVVPMQEGSDRVPFCCVAAPEVNSLGYVALGRHLGPDQPLFILHSRYRSNRSQPYTRKELSDMAAINITALRETLPNGPYCLGGMCDGVHIAFEMARQLREAGEEVPFLVSFDAWPEENTRTRFGLWIWCIRSFIRQSDLSFSRKVKRIAGFSWVALTEWTFLSLRKAETNGWISRYWPGRNFVPDRFDGRILVLRVDRQESFRISRKDLGWSDWTTDGVDVYNVPGEHSTILRNENVSEVAVVVRRELDRIVRNGKASDADEVDGRKE
jgi:thioesterase domain-containing protein/acyl carrier protein